MSSKPFEFENSLKELEAITAWFESTDADLDQGIAKFERGMELSQALRAHLGEVENRIEKIRQRFAPGASSGSATENPAEATNDTAEAASVDRRDPDAPPAEPAPGVSDQTDLFGA